MTEFEPEVELEPGDYDMTEEDAEFTPVPAVDAQPAAPEVDAQDEVEGFGAAGDAPRTPEQALATARTMSLNNTWVGVGLCLKTVRSYYGVGAKYLSAIDSWNNADHKVRRTSGRDIPRGVPVYFSGGQHGHIAISAGGGNCWSTDWREPGRINLANIDELARAWGRPLLGYAWEVNDVVVWKPAPPKPKKPVVSLRNVRPGKSNKDVLKVKRALRKKKYVSGMFALIPYWGKGMTKAYAKYQRRLGYSGKAADGVPGRASLRKLGFRVNP